MRLAETRWMIKVRVCEGEPLANEPTLDCLTSRTRDQVTSASRRAQNVRELFDLSYVKDKVRQVFCPRNDCRDRVCFPLPFPPFFPQSTRQGRSANVASDAEERGAPKEKEKDSTLREWTPRRTPAPTPPSQRRWSRAEPLSVLPIPPPVLHLPTIEVPRRTQRPVVVPPSSSTTTARVTPIVTVGTRARRRVAVVGIGSDSAAAGRRTRAERRRRRTLSRGKRAVGGC